MSPPRFLRLDDSSRLLVEVNNVAGPAGSYKVELITGEGLSTDAAVTTFDLAKEGRTSLNLGLTGTQIGDNDLKVIITQPDGVTMVKDLTLGVRAASTEQTTSVLIPIGPGETITLDASRFEHIIEHTGFLTLAVGAVARLDVPELLFHLDRYPYGCAEQVSSRAMPLLYLNEVAQSLGLGTDDTLDQKIKDAIADLLSKQTSAGSFGLWGAYSWTDPLARFLCHGVPAPRQGRGLCRAGAGADHGARQSGQPGELCRGLREGRRGHRLCAVRSGSRRPCRHRRPALLFRGPS